MSALGSIPPAELRTYMLRSATPASNEKGAVISPRCTLIISMTSSAVLLYLEGMQGVEPENEDFDRFEEAPASDAGSRVSSQQAPRSQASRKSRSHVSRSQLSRRSREPGFEPIEEIRSDVQEQSEVAKTIPIQSEAAGANVSHSLSRFTSRSFRRFRRGDSLSECAYVSTRSNQPGSIWSPQTSVFGRSSSLTRRIRRGGTAGPSQGLSPECERNSSRSRRCRRLASQPRIPRLFTLLIRILCPRRSRGRMLGRCVEDVLPLNLGLLVLSLYFCGLNLKLTNLRRA